MDKPAPITEFTLIRKESTRFISVYYTNHDVMSDFVTAASDYGEIGYNTSQNQLYVVVNPNYDFNEVANYIEHVVQGGVSDGPVKE